MLLHSSHQLTFQLARAHSDCLQCLQSRAEQEAAEKALREERVKELEALVRENLEREKNRESIGEAKRTRSNSLVRRPTDEPASPGVALRPGSNDSSLMEPDEGAATLETVKEADFLIILGYLEIDTISQLRTVSKRIQFMVDDLLPLKPAFVGWEALLENIYDVDAWEYRLDYIPLTGTLADRDFVRGTFRSLCKAGSTIIALKVIDAFKITQEDVMHEEAGPFRDCCRYGHQPLALRLADDFELNRNVVRLRENYCIGTACQYGHIEVVNWLCDVRWNLELSDVRADDNFALRYAALNGHCDVIQFLLERFPFTRADVLTDSLFAVRIACQKGFENVARLLVSHFRLGPEDLRSMGNYALYYACEEGHAEIVDWLLYDVGLERKDILDTGNAKKSPFLGACIRGNIEVATILTEAGEISTQDVQVRHSEVFRLCCEHGQMEMCQWLAEAFDLSIEDVRAMEYFSVRKAHSSGYEELKNWLIAHFHLTSDDAVALRPHLL